LISIERHIENQQYMGVVEQPTTKLKKQKTENLTRT